MDGRYRDKLGHEVRILCIDAPGDKPVIGIQPNGTILRYYPTGHYSYSIDDDYDLVEHHPYDDFKMDEPVKVRNRPDEPWELRHFAGVREDHRLLTWIDGGTSWTRTTTVSWKYAERKDS